MKIENKRLTTMIIFQLCSVIVWFCFLEYASSGLLGNVFSVLCLPGRLILYFVKYINDSGIKILAVIACLAICPFAQIVAYSFIGYGVSRLIFPNKKFLPKPPQD